MTDTPEFDRDDVLYARWRAADGPLPHAAKPSAMMLAAYIDGRLDPAAVEAVEAALAEDPFLVSELVAVRRSLPKVVVSNAFIDRARRLVQSPYDMAAGARIIPFKAPERQPLRGIVAWGALAASVLVVSMVGFNLGVATQQATEPAPGATSVDLLEAADSVVG